MHLNYPIFLPITLAPLQPLQRPSDLCIECVLSSGDWIDKQAYGNLFSCYEFECKHLP